MLERVPLLEKNLDDYADVVGAEARSSGSGSWPKPLQGARVLHVNATAYGGGVAELLATHVPLLRDVGIDAEWQVIHGSDEFFAVTKAVHNALQGADVEWTAAMQRTYLERVLDNALLLEGEWDYIVIHDPQPAAMLDFLARAPRRTSAGHQVDLALPHRPHRREPRASGSSSARSSSSTTRRCGRCRSSFPASLDMDTRRARAAVHRPALGEEPRARRCRSCQEIAASTASTSTARSSAR